MKKTKIKLPVKKGKSAITLPAKEAGKKAVSTAVVIASLEKRAKDPEKKLQKVPTIKDQNDLDIVGENLKLIKELSKEATQQEEKITGPIVDSIKKLKGSIKATEELFAPFQDKMVSLETNEKLKISIYLARLDKAQEKLDQDMEDGKIAKVSTYTDKSSKLTISTGGNFQARGVQVLEIDEKLFTEGLRKGKIERDLVSIDKAAVKQALKDGRTVPGCKLVKQKSIAV